MPEYGVWVQRIPEDGTHWVWRGRAASVDEAVQTARRAFEDLYGPMRWADGQDDTATALNIVQQIEPGDAGYRGG